jgi:hypothetical protein
MLARLSGRQRAELKPDLAGQVIGSDAMAADCAKEAGETVRRGSASTPR